MTGPGPETADIFAPLIRALSGDDGVLLTVAAWIAALRVALKPISVLIQTKLSEALVRVAESPEVDDDTVVLRIVTSRGWRLTAFVLDLVASVKLPGRAEFERAVSAPKQPSH